MKISKINQELEKACNELNDLIKDHSEDFDTRGGYLVANIKNYQWLDEDDVLAAMAKNKVPASRTEEFLEEFNDDRLYGILNHCAEWEIEYFKEDFGSKDMLSERGEDTNFGRFAAAVDMINGDKGDVWQFGRSGGWLSYAQKSILDIEENYDDQTIVASNFWGESNRFKKNQDYNDFFSYYLDYAVYNGRATRTVHQAKKELISQINATILEITGKIEACQTIEKWIGEIKDGFIEVCREQLNHEVGEFWEEIKTENEAGDPVLITGNATLRIEGELLKTSKGASVPINEAKILFQSLNFTGDVIQINKQLGSYKVERAQRYGDDWIIKAGCHKIALSELKRLFS